MGGRASIENGKKGGRPKGRKSDLTLMKEAKLQAILDRVYTATDALITAQVGTGIGTSYLYMIETNAKTKQKSRPVLITAQSTIESYLAGDLNEQGDNEYYYITTERPDNRAIDSLFDRAFGKAAQTMEITSGGKAIKSNTIVFKSFNGTNTDSK